jgi:cell division protein FtsB
MRLRELVLLAALAVAAGCTQLQEQQDQIAALGAQIATLDESLQRTEAQLSELQVGQSTVVADVAASRAGVSQLEDSIQRLPDTMTAWCHQQETAQAECQANQVQRVFVSGDKMVLGELETVWIDPPGLSLNARIDTGATTNSLNAEDMVEFERDGDDWVRFHVRDTDTKDLIEIEREVVRYVRVFQQADPEGTRRPVVSLRLYLGDVRDPFEFTLADRSHLNYQILLGRSFLTDIALVDVGRQFIQPRYRPNRSE